MINTDNYTVATATVTMVADDDSNVDYVLNGEYTTTDNSSSVEVLDGNGDYEGEILNESKPTASISVRAPAGENKKPKKFSSFTYEGNVHTITSVNESKGGNSPLSFTVEATITGIAP